MSNCPDCAWMEKEIKRLDIANRKLRKQLRTYTKKEGSHWDSFENLWNQYPERKGKHKAWLHFRAQVKTPEDLENIYKALRNYKKDMARIRQKNPDREWLHGETWFNHRWEDFIDYKAPGKNGKPHQMKKVEAPKPEDCVSAKDLQKLVKDFNKSLKGVNGLETD